MAYIGWLHEAATRANPSPTVALIKSMVTIFLTAMVTIINSIVLVEKY